MKIVIDCDFSQDDKSMTLAQLRSALGKLIGMTPRNLSTWEIREAINQVLEEKLGDG